jgi:hypothetical protein
MKLKTITLIIICIILTGNTKAFAQEDTNKRQVNNLVGITYQAGSVMQTNDFVAGENASGNPINYFQSLRFEYGVKTDGRKMWHQLYAYPEWGVGLYFANFFNEAELGTPTAFYGYFKGPFWRWRKLSFNYNVGFGLTWNWQPYNTEANPYNIAIGSYRTVYIDAGLNLDWQVARRLTATFGVSFTHFSNGATSVPNMGLNLAAPSVGLKYQLKKDPPDLIKWDVPEYEDNWEFVMIVAGGVKQVEFDTTNTELKDKYLGVNYGVLSLMPTINRQISHKVKFGAGLDLAYDGSINAQIDVNSEGEYTTSQVPFWDRTSLSVFASFELVAGRLSLLVQPGYTLFRYNFEGEKPAFYQRAGLRYFIWKDLFLGINIRAHNFGVADYIEWNAGWRIKW